ncbi:hypothetical protein POM88_017479 [Heracleum sosnowskyi]|uniref:Replication factor A C-terminal domain-containing protein n=1 Tax=Heracleum sosnowskyi TaxID=360622 RepID=A0AAD8IPJ2_9APIA|nr:hypothetical protein POM88_017479 [Heracleum sosnowskyi]
MWVSVSTAGSKDESNSITGYNAILLDDDNFHIQAFIYADKWSQIVNNHTPPLIPDYATDIIGVVENLEKLSHIPTKYGQRNIVKFRIFDGSAKLQKFMNSVQISTMPSSKIYFNLDTDVVKSLRKRLAHQGYKTPEDIGSVSTVSNSVQVVETLTLKELTEKTSTDYIKRNVTCFVTIKRVEADDSWWYYGCNFCHEEVNLLEGRYKCVNPKCLKRSPYAEKRFRIMVLAHDKTEAVNVVLSDRVVKRLVGKTATMLLEEIEDLAETPPSTLFPQQILDIANKDVTFNILISDDNVLINSTMYNSTDAYLSKKSKSSTSETVEEMLQSTESGFGEVS